MDDNVKQYKPTLLRFLCVLTFIWSGLCMFAVISVFTRGYPHIFFSSIPVLDSIITEDTHGNNFYLLTKPVLYALSIAGAAVMWTLRSSGFYMYLGAQIVLLAVPFIFLSHLGINYLLVKFFIDLIFTALFIMLYAFQMRRKQP
ncbi:MAG: hypothetical protein WCM76_13440 [Bacteroidota bacterium]